MGESQKTIIAVFSQSGGVKQGDSVLFSGISVGAVRDVILLSDGSVRMNLSIRSDIDIYRNATIRVQSSDLLGGMMLTINPGSKTSGEISGNFIIQGIIPENGGSMVQEAKSLVGDFKIVLEKLDKSIANIDIIMAEQFTPVLVNLDKVSNDAEKLLQIAQSYSDKIQKLEEKSGVDFVERADVLLTQTQTVVNEIEQIISDAQKEGSPLHKMVLSDSLYNQIQRTISAADSLILDIQNNPQHYLKNLDVKVKLFNFGDNE